MIQLFCGGIVGITHFVLGQPLDYLKVKLQTNANATENKNIVNVTKQMIKQNGYKGLYKGASISTIGLPVITSIQFSVYQAMKKKLMKLYKYQRTQSPEQMLKLHHIGLAGMTAEIITSILSCPIQYAKIQKQAQINNNHKSSISIFNEQIKQKNIKNLYKGIGLSAQRQALGGFAYFLTYEAVVRKISEMRGLSRKFANFNDFMVGGAAAGVAYWALVYPLDCIKSRMQVGIINSYKKDYLSIFNKQYYKGFMIAIARGALINSVSFALYEQIKGISEMINLMSKM